MKILHAVWALNQETQSVQIGIYSNYTLNTFNAATLIEVDTKNNTTNTIDILDSLEYSSYINFEQKVYTTYELLVKRSKLNKDCIYYLALTASLTNKQGQTFSISTSSAITLTEYLPIVTDNKYNILTPDSETNIILDSTIINITPSLDIAADDKLIGYRYLIRNNTTDTTAKNVSEFIYNDKINFSITNKTYGDFFNVLVMYYTQKGYYGWFEYNFAIREKENNVSVSTIVNKVEIINDYVSFDLIFANKNTPLNGQIKIERKESSVIEWMPLFSFDIPLYQTSIDFKFKDRSIEAGKTYKYRIYYEWVDENNIRQASSFIDTDEFYITFDEVYLSDATTTVPLRFNVELTNLKYNIADSITPTLGGRYPFVRRNGQQNYRTFTLGGLISYHMEESDINIAVPDDFSHYEKERFLERVYRDKLFEFLHNGKTKIFKSFQEGTMLVNLSNISLTSNKSLDRNIYSFSAQVTEVGDIKPTTMQDFADFVISVPAVYYNEYILNGTLSGDTVTISSNWYDEENEAIILSKNSIYFGDKEGE